MRVEIFNNKEDIAKTAANEFKKVMRDNPKAVLGLATGSSPVGTYHELVEYYKKGEIDFKEVITFNLDEYVGIDRDHAQSYFHFMYEHLFRHVDIDYDNVNIPAGTGDLDEICREYNQKLDEHEIDVQILGIGSNGHIAFNEPGTSFDEVTHVANLDESTIEDNARFFGSKSEVPTQAISMGLKNIMAAKKIVLIATGASKADAVNKMINGDVTTDVPASILQNHDNVLVLLDSEAGAQLEG